MKILSEKTKSKMIKALCYDWNIKRYIKEFIREMRLK